jgi:hypothetical protein
MFNGLIILSVLESIIAPFLEYDDDEKVISSPDTSTIISALMSMLSSQLRLPNMVQANLFKSVS